ncbi:MAG: hypothetical protein V2I45_10520 [Halieaceae bacterium]|jgi:hypothetical protein|nr:hypothetical protein [Halieaceae bacterium]
MNNILRNTLAIVGAALVGANPVFSEQDTHLIYLEEPAEGSIMSGVANLRGWAVSTEGVNRIELFVDGQFEYFIPYGGERVDVFQTYPDVPDSGSSGFGQTFNYNKLYTGDHVMTVRMITERGQMFEQTNHFKTINFGSEFISDPDFPDITGATTTLNEDGTITISPVRDENTQPYSVKLKWTVATQGFEIIDIQPLLQ